MLHVVSIVNEAFWRMNTLETDPIELTSASDFLASTMRPRGTKGLVEEDALSLLSGIRCLWIGMGRRGGGDAGR